ncbi:hypothetical protein [Marinicella sp. W31]|uniref:hypothetical protein n=1 Tax=Marinicella sp. W31 TaxID=3023713 RepID=UPI00375845BA
MEIKINKSRSFTVDHDYNSFCVVRVYGGHLKALGGRHAWVKLTANDKSIYRTIKAGRRIAPALTKDAIEIDYDSMLELEQVSYDNKKDEADFYPCDISVLPATRWEQLKALWQHPDQGYRVSMKISLIGLFLGVIGFITGLLSLG